MDVGADDVGQQLFHQHARRRLVLHQQHPHRRMQGLQRGILRRRRRRHSGERWQGAGRHLEQFAPLAPLGDDAVDQAALFVGVEAELAAEQHQLRNEAAAFRLRRQAHVGNALAVMEKMRQSVGPRALGEPGSIRRLVMDDRLDQGMRHAAVLEDGGSEFVVVGAQVLAFQRRQIALARALAEQLGIFGGVDGRQRQAADARHQAAGEHLLGRAGATAGRQRLHGHRHQQRMRPETIVVEAFALSVPMLVHHGKAHGHLAHGGHAQAHDGVGYGGHRAGGAQGGGVGQAQQTSGQRRVGLHHAGDSLDAGVLAPAELHDGQRHALGARQLAIQPQLFDFRQRGLVPDRRGLGAHGFRIHTSSPWLDIRDPNRGIPRASRRRRGRSCRWPFFFAVVVGHIVFMVSASAHQY